jgi:hypothetical protein
MLHQDGLILVLICGRRELIGDFSMFRLVEIYEESHLGIIRITTSRILLFFLFFIDSHKNMRFEGYVFSF